LVNEKIIAALELKRQAIRLLLKEWSISNLRKFSWRNRSNPYEILVAEILLKRTTAKAVSKIYDLFLEKYPSILHLSRANVEELSNIMRSLGYYNQRAEQFKIISKHILNKYNKKFPYDMEGLKDIPFVGTYTACSILCFSYNLPYSMVDSNVIRVISRVFENSCEKANVKTIEIIATSLIPDKHFKEFNLSLLDLGGTICMPRNPKCFRCPLANICDYFNNKSASIN
jgi:A/G-specific adenine glycosylase